MKNQRIGGIFLFTIGLILFIFGMDSADSFSDRLSNILAGHWSRYTAWLVLPGIATAVAGLLILMTAGGRRPSI